MSLKRNLFLLALAGAFCASPPASATDPFLLDITVAGGQTSPQNQRFGFGSVDEAIDKLSFEQLQQSFSNYSFSSLVDVGMDFRGLGAAMNFPGQSANLTFSVPGVTINPGGQNPDQRIFQGQGANGDSARKDALAQLKDYLKKNKDALKALLTALAQRSPIDPLAGNPLSLQSQMMARNFEYGFTHKVSQIWGCSTTAFELNRERPILIASASDDLSGVLADAQNRAAALRGRNELGLGAQYQTSTAPIRGSALRSGDFNSYSLTLPLSYTVNFDARPGHKLRFDLPLTTVDSDGSKSYALGFGVGYTYPVNEVWSLTPAVGVGATGSTDLGSAGGMSSLSIASSFTHRFDSFALSIGNLIGQYSSLKLKLGDVEAAADVKNTVFTNGVLVSGPNSLIARNLVVEYSLTDTRLSGDTVYSKRYDELGVSLGRLTTEQGVVTSYLKGGLSYVTGEQGLKGFKLSLGWRF